MKLTTNRSVKGVSRRGWTVLFRSRLGGKLFLASGLDPSALNATFYRTRVEARGFLRDAREHGLVGRAVRATLSLKVGR
jgi:hypothetical protein